MKKLIRKILREFVDKSDSCRVKFDYFNVFGYACYLNFSDISDIEKVKNNVDDCKDIEIYNDSGETFKIPVDKIRFTKDNQKPYVPKNYFYEKIYPELNVNTKLIGGINSKNIRNALKMAFKGTENWTDETESMSEGVINIEPTVGGNNWSVMNYFDTKTEVHNRLKALISQDYNKNPETLYGDYFNSDNDDKETYDELVVKWLSNVFKGEIHGNKLNDIKNVQKSSIESGEMTEKEAIEYVNAHPNVIGLNGVTKKVVYEPGHKKDRWGGIDAEFYGDGVGPIGIQIKPLSSYDKKNNSVNVGSSNVNDYSGKKGIQYLVFFNNKTRKIMVFDNSNYVISGSSYIFADKPVYPKF